MNQAMSAVLWPGDKRLALEAVEIEDPRKDEVLVRIVASGICHTDMVMRDGGVPTPQPVVLGHEGAGIIEKVGDGVTHLKPGDSVVLSFASCGHCRACSHDQPAYCQAFFPLNFFGARADGSTAIRCKGAPVHSHIFGQSSFSTRAVCHHRNVVKVEDDLPLELLAPFGCGFQTGAGAVLNSLQVRSGSAVMVLGAGTVGMCAIMAARIAGARQIVAVDLHDNRLAVARALGASHSINPERQELENIGRAACPDGIDYVIDTTGYLPLVERTVALLANRGVLGLAAAYRPGSQLPLDVVRLMSTGLTIRGIVEGDTDIQTFIPRLIGYFREGLFPVDKLIQCFAFSEINRAIEASETGEAIKAVVVMPD